MYTHTHAIKISQFLYILWKIDSKKGIFFIFCHFCCRITDLYCHYHFTTDSFFDWAWTSRHDEQRTSGNLKAWHRTYAFFFFKMCVKLFFVCVSVYVIFNDNKNTCFSNENDRLGWNLLKHYEWNVIVFKIRNGIEMEILFLSQNGVFLRNIVILICFSFIECSDVWILPTESLQTEQRWSSFIDHIENVIDTSSMVNNWWAYSSFPYFFPRQLVIKVYW